MQHLPCQVGVVGAGMFDENCWWLTKPSWVRGLFCQKYGFHYCLQKQKHVILTLLNNRTNPCWNMRKIEDAIYFGKNQGSIQQSQWAWNQGRRPRFFFHWAPGDQSLVFCEIGKRISQNKNGSFWFVNLFLWFSNEDSLKEHAQEPLNVYEASSWLHIIWIHQKVLPSFGLCCLALHCSVQVRRSWKRQRLSSGGDWTWCWGLPAIYIPNTDTNTETITEEK